MDPSLYLDRDTWVHRLDPRTKMFLLLGMFALAFVFLNPFYEAGVLVAVLLFGYLARALVNLRRIWFILVAIAVLSVILWSIFGGGRTPLFLFVKLEALLYGLSIALRIDITVIAGMIFLSTTRNEEVVIGLVRLGIPYRFAFAVSTALRLIPTIIATASTIGQAQRSRGLDLGSGNVVQRIRKYAPLLVPVFVSTIRSTNVFSMALESKGFGASPERTFFLQVAMSRRDALVLIAFVALLAGAIALRAAGYGGKDSAGDVVIGELGRRGTVREVFTMWRHTQMVVLVALSAAIYAAILIPFKGFPIIPGAIEIRPANALPVVFGLLFGPAGAWGAAIGNLIGDFFGTLTLGSIAGFVGNFFFALLPYKMWGAYFRSGENAEPNADSGKKLGLYAALALLASAVCAAMISWFVDLLGLFPFVATLALITSNNAIMAIVLGPILLLALYPRVKRWGLLWTEIMNPEEVSASRLQKVGNVLVWIGGIGAVVLGLILGLSAGPQGLGIGLGLIPFLILIVVGSFMLGGREQVEAAEEMMAAEEEARA